MQVWSDLDHQEWTKLFIILNTGQQKVNPRHLLEVDQSELYQIFVDWGLPTTTMPSEKDHPIPRGRKPDKEVLAEMKQFRFENLINGLIAYNNPNQHIKTSPTLHDKSAVSINSEYCEINFKWVCIELNNIIRKKSGVKKEHNILFGEAFFIPLMAAIGWARQDPTTMPQVEFRQSDLINLLEGSKLDDPMVLEDEKRGLNNIVLDSKSNIGKKRRDMIYYPWKDYLRIGATNPSYPINWQEGKNAS